MIRACVLFGGSVLVLACAADRGAAQPPLPVGPGAPGITRPTFSPYLNLTNRNVDPAVTYYGIVKPQFTTNRAIQGLQTQVAASANQQMNELQPAVDPGLPATGQQTYFLNTGGYFLNSRPGAGPLVNNVTNRTVVLSRPTQVPQLPNR
jgi:hypothetical protein